jgi:hypothetical protein
MVLDTSAILAILQDEPGRRKLNEAIEAAETRSLSTASFVECSMILESLYGPDGVRDFDLFMAKAQISLVPVDEEQANWDAIGPGSILVTAFRTPWHMPATNRSCSKETTFRRLMLSATPPVVSNCRFTSEGRTCQLTAHLPRWADAKLIDTLIDPVRH